MALLQQKLPNGSYFIPTPQITSASLAKSLGYDAVLTGSNATANVDQGIANVDYVVNDKDRLGVKYYVQQDPTNNPFAPLDSLIGFGQNINAGSQVGAITNTVILTPSLTWTQKVGLHAHAGLRQHQPGLHAQPVRHQSVRGKHVPADHHHQRRPHRSARACRSETARPSATRGCFRTNWNTGRR